MQFGWMAFDGQSITIKYTRLGWTKGDAKKEESRKYWTTAPQLIFTNPSSFCSIVKIAPTDCLSSIPFFHNREPAAQQQYNKNERWSFCIACVHGEWITMSTTSDWELIPTNTDTTLPIMIDTNSVNLIRRSADHIPHTHQLTERVLAAQIIIIMIINGKMVNIYLMSNNKVSTFVRKYSFFVRIVKHFCKQHSLGTGLVPEPWPRL